MEVEEPMDVDGTEDFDNLLEEGEYVESNRVTRSKVIPSVISIPESTYENKAGTFITGVDIFSKEAKQKMEDRAKRFGFVKLEEGCPLKEAENLYNSFGIDENTENAKNYRLNVLHMRGTENMSTKDIFKYFVDYAPASLEWINDISCNVVWLDQASAARAILGLSRKIVGVRKVPKKKLDSDDESEDESDEDTVVNGKDYSNENVIHIKDIRCPVPPGIWRKGREYMESRNIFLRFATRADRKPLHGEKMSESYRKRGNLKYGAIKGILMENKKRSHKQISKESKELKVKTEPETEPTNGIAAKNPWGSLSKNWGVTDFVEDDYLPKAPIEPASSVKERLGFKHSDREDEGRNSNVIELSDESESSESSSEEENWCKRSKIPRMRMHADDEEEKIQKRKGKIRDLMNLNGPVVKGSDLRGRLTARRRLPPPVIREEIQVVVTNPKAVRSGNFRNVNVTEDEEEEDYDEEDARVLQQDDDDEEEGEIVDDSENDSKVEYEEDDEGEDIKDESESESESDSDSSDSSVSEKEVQGPKGSVIKVVQHKPKLASTVSTVWSRLNHSMNDKNDRKSPERYSKTDLRHTLRKNDLRSRIGNNYMRGRSPLRIELRNDKYSGRLSDSD